MAETPNQLEQRRWGKTLVRGLVLGGLAFGLPAAANHWLARRRVRPLGTSWIRVRHWRWSGGTVAFRRLGPEVERSGPPTAETPMAATPMDVVLLHSFLPGSDGEEWRRVAERLARDRPVWIPDLLGWGRSDKPPLEIHRAEGIALYRRLVVDFLDRVVGRPAVVVAAGLAAPAAVEAALATQAPVAGAEDDGERDGRSRGRVARLGLVAPRGLGPSLDPGSGWERALRHLLWVPVLGTSALYLATSRGQLTRYLADQVYAAPERVDAALVHGRWQSSHQPGSHRTLAALFTGALAPRDGIESRLAGLRVPVWMAWGRQSRTPPPEAADRWLRHLPQATLTVLAESGSLPHQEVPDAFTEALEVELLDGPG